MEGVIVNYRRGKMTQDTSQYVLEISGVSDRSKAHSLVGARVSWKTSSGKEIIGKVSKAHGNKGAVLAKFEKGLPGQAVGTKIEVKN